MKTWTFYLAFSNSSIFQVSFLSIFLSQALLSLSLSHFLKRNLFRLKLSWLCNGVTRFQREKKFRNLLFLKKTTESPFLLKINECCGCCSSVGKASWVKVPQRGATELTWVWFPVTAKELGEKSKPRYLRECEVKHMYADISARIWLVAKNCH